MVKGALGALGATALLAIGCAQAFALDPAPTVPVPTVSVPAVPVPVPTVSVPTVPVPTPPVSVPVVTSPVPSAPTSPAPPPSVPVSAPSTPSLPGSTTASSSSGSTSGTGGSASGQGSSSQGASAGSSSSLGSSGQESSNGDGGRPRSARSKATRHRSGALRRFESRPPKFRSRGKGRRGTTLVVWLSTDSLVRFSFVQIAPDCRGIGGFIRAGEQGKNRFLFSGRIDGRSLRAGTYRIRAAAVRGQETTSVRRETVVVVAPGQSVRAASAQKTTCGPGDEAAEARAATAAFADAGSGEPPTTRTRPVEVGSAWAHGESAGSQAGGGNGGVVAPEGVAPPADFLVQPSVPNLAIGSDVDGGWPRPVIATVGVMFIALVVIGGRELAERYRRRGAGLP
jgi:hypothetical protein